MLIGPITRVYNPNDISISISSAVSAGLTILIDRQTNHATRSVTIGRIYVVLQCGVFFLKKNLFTVGAIPLLESDAGVKFGMEEGSSNHCVADSKLEL